ncbi:hypothetical protein DM01DRAFT_1384595 [Hesseltinella vesiculosa]|uniref:Uncharacterized protein n=1 Tax=Hesseltinella vesiculosa TaxID=101127 RepID=A0A1X2GCN6_9FUNG|nr:hypothetical protein DM01DRAFT_1384595 [Hesseltinella vesiculosa]
MWPASGWHWHVELILFLWVINQTYCQANEAGHSPEDGMGKRVAGSLRPSIAFWAVHADNLLGHDEGELLASPAGLSRFGHGVANGDSTGHQTDPSIDIIHPSPPKPQILSDTDPDALAANVIPDQNDEFVFDHETTYSSGSDSSTLRVWPATITVVVLAVGTAFTIIL